MCNLSTIDCQVEVCHAARRQLLRAVSPLALKVMLTPCIFKLEMSTMGICVAKPPQKVVFTTYSNRDVSRCSRHTAHSAPQLSVLSYLLKVHELCMQARCTGQTVSSFVYQLSDARVLAGAEALQGWMSQSDLASPIVVIGSRRHLW